uniref:AAA_28 domain-containing protein n=1 Tax=Steinernema glaseri TaxID=37863 RepID=A0A1I7ZKN2_9BILA
MRRNKFNKYYCKIVLTGGPCSGKTTLTTQLAERVRQEYGDEWQVFTVMEASTLLYSGGVARRSLTTDQLAVWQRDMLLTIFRLEEVFGNIAVNEKRKHTMIICDRGGMDPKAYTKTEDQWHRIIDSLDISEESILNRYDMILRFHTAPRNYYDNVTNKMRREDYAEARKVDERYDSIWNSHPLFFNIPADLDMQGKSDRALLEIGNLIENTK